LKNNSRKRTRQGRGVFRSNLDFECVGADGAMFGRFAFQASPGEVHLREGETGVAVVEFGKFLGKIVDVFKREFVEGVLSKFANFVANTVRAVKGGVGLENPSGGRNFDLFETEEMLAKEDVVLGEKVPNESFEDGEQLIEAADFDKGVDVTVLFFGSCQRKGFVEGGFVGGEVDDANFLVVGAVEFCFGKLIGPIVNNQIDDSDDLGRGKVGPKG
jgi:hypothetical protein